MKKFIKTLTILYAGSMIPTAIVSYKSIPILTPVGAAYYAVTWPYQIYCDHIPSQDCETPIIYMPYWFKTNMLHLHLAMIQQENERHRN